jgi:hypothetical protein
MMATAYVEAWPKIEPHNGLFLVTVTSGGEEITLMLTRFALNGLMVGGGRALAEATVAEAEFAPIPFPKRRKGRK